MPNVLSVTLLDNRDSFTYNLAEEFAVRGAQIEVIRHEATARRVLAQATRPGGPRLLVISPGPGTPSAAGCCLEVVRGALGRVPLFGVCLGHQALVEATGGTVARAPEAVHGKAVSIGHDGKPPFNGLPSPMPAGRYHSLVATALPAELELAAEADGIVMAVRHRHAPAIGVQFHPESVLTPEGGRLIGNVIAWAIHAGR